MYEGDDKSASTRDLLLVQINLKVNLGLTDADVSQEDITETKSCLVVFILIGEGRLVKPHGRGVFAFPCIHKSW